MVSIIQHLLAVAMALFVVFLVFATVDLLVQSASASRRRRREPCAPPHPLPRARLLRRRGWRPM